MEIVRWYVCKYYTNTKDLTVTVGMFIKEEDAREYYRWQKRRLAAENKKRSVPRVFVWQLCKCTESLGDDGSCRSYFEVVEG